MNDLDHCYKVLGLKPGASIDEVNQAYKDLAFIWHPDRIPPDNSRLQQKAQEKLKELNQARDRLRSVQQPVTSKKAEAKPAPAPQKATPTRREPPSRPHYQSPSQYYHHVKKPSPDLSGADLRGANLKEKDLSGRNLSYADLSHADLSDTFLHRVNLQGATLEKANLFRANLLQANLSHANLREANLISADLSGADLRGADLRGAKVGSKNRLMVKLTGTNLSGAILPNGEIHE